MHSPYSRLMRSVSLSCSGDLGWDKDSPNEARDMHTGLLLKADFPGRQLIHRYYDLVPTLINLYISFLKPELFLLRANEGS